MLNRRAKWEESIKLVNKQNEDFLAGKSTWSAAINQFSSALKKPFWLDN